MVRWTESNLTEVVVVGVGILSLQEWESRTLTILIRGTKAIRVIDKSFKGTMTSSSMTSMIGEVRTVLIAGLRTMTIRMATEADSTNREAIRSLVAEAEARGHRAGTTHGPTKRTRTTQISIEVPRRENQVEEEALEERSTEKTLSSNRSPMDQTEVAKLTTLSSSKATPMRANPSRTWGVANLDQVIIQGGPTTATSQTKNQHKSCQMQNMSYL